MSDTAPAVTTVSDGGLSVTSNSETSEQIKTALNDGQEPEADGISKAAREMGRKGAQARWSRAREIKPIPDKPKVEAKPESAPEGTPEPREASPEAPEAKEAKPAEKPLGKPRDDPRARMLEATRKEAEAKRAAAALQAERDALKAELDRVRSVPAPQERINWHPTVVSEDAPPDPKNFRSEAEYAQAYIDHRAAQQARTIVQAELQRAAQAARQQQFEQEFHEMASKHVEGFKSAMDKQIKADPGFVEKLSPDVLGLSSSLEPSVQTISADNVIADEIILSGENAPALSLYLSEHPDEFQRLRALPTYQEVQVEMRILAKSLKGAATAGTVPKGEVSKAKPPVRPVTGSPHAVTDLDEMAADENVSFADYAKARGLKRTR